MAAERRRAPTFTTARVKGGVVVERGLHRERLCFDGGDPDVVDELLTEADAKAAALFDGMVRVVVGDDRESSCVDGGPARRREWTPDAEPLSLIVRPDPRVGEALFKKTVDRQALEVLDEEARSLGVDGVLLTAPDGALREGTWFSFVLLLDGEWCAPPVGEGVLFSTTRERFRRSLQVMDAPLIERQLTFEDLTRAEGAVALSALLGASAVWRVGDVCLDASPSLFSGSR